MTPDCKSVGCLIPENLIHEKCGKWNSYTALEHRRRHGGEGVGLSPFQCNFSHFYKSSRSAELFKGRREGPHQFIT